MKSTMIQTLTATMTATVAFLALSHGAQASNAGEYRAAMRDFAPVIESWAAEADTTLAAAALKPEQACTESMGEMARRGESIRADLAGMGVEAPLAVKHSHLAVTAGLAGMITQAQTACGRAAEAHDAVAAGYKAFTGPMKRIRLFVR